MKLEFSQSFEETERAEGINQEYLERIEHSLEEEVERILNEEEKLGEGKTARVFSIAASRFPLPVCVKIWKRHVLRMQDEDLIEYRKMQYSSPQDEFQLQDDLYRNGFTKIPRPIAFGMKGEYQVLAMEELPGYTLEEIAAAGATVDGAQWKDLERLVYDLNIKKGVVHRDLGKQNIFLKTGAELKEDATVAGELYLIDFGLSKKIAGSPEPDDYRLTIGNNVIRYQSDRGMVEALKPAPGRNNLFAR